MRLRAGTKRHCPGASGRVLSSDVVGSVLFMFLVFYEPLNQQLPQKGEKYAK